MHDISLLVIIPLTSIVFSVYFLLTELTNALLIFYSDKLIVLCKSKNLHVFNFVIVFKSRKFVALEIYTFYSSNSKVVNFVALAPIFKCS